MRLAALVPLVGFILNLLLGLLVLRADRRATSNRVYFLWSLTVAVWNFGQYNLFTVDTPAEGLFWARFCWFGVIFIPVLLYHLSLLIAAVPVYRSIWVLYGVSMVFAAANFTDLFIPSVRLLGRSGYYANPGPCLWAFPLLFCITFCSIAVLLRRRKGLLPHNRSRLDALIAGQTVLIILGTNDLLPVLGVERYPFTAVDVYPYGNSAAVLYGLIFAYSVLQQNLLEVHVQFSRVAAQAVRFLFFSVIGLFLMLTVTMIVPHAFSQNSFLLALGVLIITGITSSILFPRLFGERGLDKWEQRILGDRFEYQDQVRQFLANMTWYTTMDELLENLHHLFTRTLQLRSYSIILRDETTTGFALCRQWPETIGPPLPELKPRSPVFRFFEWGKGEYLALNKSSLRFGVPSLERQAREQLESLNSELCFALSSQHEPFGLLLVGGKEGGQPFTATDINLLVALVKTMALVLNQIRLKTQIQHTQELDLLGRMSRGMAHDLNNLLTPVSTLLQLSTETGTLEGELLPVALRNVSTMRAYIKEALFFSENLRPDFQLSRLDDLVQEASVMAQAAREKEVAVAIVPCGEALVEMDAVLVQRMLGNLITNAIDASPAGATVRVTIETLNHADAARDWLRLRIIDHGEGISRENLARVFTPYFTTKDRGDENRGFGLGLAICRKIVDLHGGRLTIQSQLRRGTTVQVDLPRYQETPVLPAELSSAA